MPLQHFVPTFARSHSSTDSRLRRSISPFSTLFSESCKRFMDLRNLYAARACERGERNQRMCQPHTYSATKLARLDGCPRISFKNTTFRLGSTGLPAPSRHVRSDPITIHTQSKNSCWLAQIKPCGAVFRTFCLTCGRHGATTRHCWIFILAKLVCTGVCTGSTDGCRLTSQNKPL